MHLPIGHSVNQVSIPTSVLGSVAYNDAPAGMHIAGVRETNAQLFEMFSFSESLEDAADAFCKYMIAVYGLEPEQMVPGVPVRAAERQSRPFRSSFLRLLLGWGYDSNGPEGAVLKAWVESRFGLLPTFHKQRIDDVQDCPWMDYLAEKMTTPFHGNAIFSQLDLLYEYSQWAMEKYMWPGTSHLTLYRGVNAFEGHDIIARPDGNTCIVRLNNLVSFTASRDTADCFGETVLETEVPVSKIVFCNALLPFGPLRGEGEYLVIGGHFRVRHSRF